VVGDAGSVDCWATAAQQQNNIDTMTSKRRMKPPQPGLNQAGCCMTACRTDAAPPSPLSRAPLHSGLHPNPAARLSQLQARILRYRTWCTKSRLRKRPGLIRTRSAGVAVVFQLSPASLEKATHHQPHRALFRGGAPPDASHGVLWERPKRGSHHLLHLPALQPGMENPHPQSFYTSSLTSPVPSISGAVEACGVYNRRRHATGLWCVLLADSCQPLSSLAEVVADTQSGDQNVV